MMPANLVHVLIIKILCYRVFKLLSLKFFVLFMRFQYAAEISVLFLPDSVFFTSIFTVKYYSLLNYCDFQFLN